VNAVGYVNTTLSPGFTLVSNPLDNKATGGNQVKSLFAGLAGGTQIFVFNNATGAYATAQVDEFSGEITGAAANSEVLPGNGVFVRVDAAATVTFVGEVPAGNLSNPIPQGFSIKASQVPQAGTATALEFPAAEGDQIFVFNEATQAYVTSTYSFGEWDRVPSIDVGEAVFVRTDAAKNWTRNFNINQ